MVFLFVLGGILISLFWDKNLFVTAQNNLGFGLLVIGTILVFWAQKSSRKTKSKRIDDDKEIAKTGFIKGPYKFSRSPTHLGLFILFAGAAVLDNSFVLALASVLAFFFTRATFLKEEEKMLREKYGEVYVEYQKKVKI